MREGSIEHAICSFLQVRSSAYPVAFLLLTGLLMLCGNRNR